MKDETFLGVVQFPHPGPEHKADKDGWKAWNFCEHKRKYMNVFGSYIDKLNKKIDSELVLWGEWEPPSQVVHSWTDVDPLPSRVVQPRFPGSATNVAGLQNTDPYVFGEHFRYTLCRQGANPSLKQLQSGTLILFGSAVRKQFVLDTAFVVGQRITTHNRLTWRDQLKDVAQSVYKSVTLDPMYWDRNIQDEDIFSMYCGATQTSPLDGMFSFFPCLPVKADEYPRFARPVLEIDSVINSKSTRAPKMTQHSTESIVDVWNQVVDQVRSHGLEIGVWAEEPKKSAVPNYLWPSGQANLAI